MKYFKTYVTTVGSSKSIIWSRLYFNFHIHLRRQNFKYDFCLFQLSGLSLPNSTQIAVQATHVEVMSHFCFAQQNKTTDRFSYVCMTFHGLFLLFFMTQTHPFSKQDKLLKPQSSCIFPLLSSIHYTFKKIYSYTLKAYDHPYNCWEKAQLC